MGDGQLGGALQPGFLGARTQQPAGVGSAGEARAGPIDRVGEQQIAALAAEFGANRFQIRAAVGRETKNALSGGSAGHQAGQQIRHRFPAAAEGRLHLLFGTLVGPGGGAAVVGHRRGHGDGAGLGLQPIQGGLQLGGGADRMAAQALPPSIRRRERTVHQIHLGSPQQGGLDPAAYGLRGIGLDLRSYTKSTNLNEMVPAMLNRDAYFTLLDVPDLIIDLRRWSGKIKVLGPISEHQVLAAAFLKEAPALRDAYNEYLRGIKADGSYDRLVDKYYPGIRSYFPEFFAKIRPAK